MDKKTEEFSTGTASVFFALGCVAGAAIYHFGREPALSAVDRAQEYREARRVLAQEERATRAARALEDQRRRKELVAKVRGQRALVRAEAVQAQAQALLVRARA